MNDVLLEILDTIKKIADDIPMPHLSSKTQNQIDYLEIIIHKYIDNQ